MRFFGLIRSSGGSDDKLTCFSFLQLYRMLSMYFPAKRILGANFDNIEKTRLLASYKDGLIKDCRDRRLSVLKFKNQTKDGLN